MKTIITIVENRAMPCRYEYSLSVNGEQKVSRHDAGWDPSAAAAKAMQLAIEHSENGYIIFGPESVLSNIPAELRAC